MSLIFDVLVFMAFLFSYCFVDCKYHLTDECWSAQTYHETGLFQVNVNTSIFFIEHIVEVYDVVAYSRLHLHLNTGVQAQKFMKRTVS